MLTFCFCHAIYNLFWSTTTKIKMFCCASLILYLITCPIAQSSKDIWFSLMVSEGLDLNTSRVLPAVEQEITAINNSTILPGYKLQYTTHRHSEVKERLCNFFYSLYFAV